jgi:hypothetical protein
VRTDIAAALVTEPALMALVILAGLAMAAALAVWTVDQVRRLSTQDDDHG